MERYEAWGEGHNALVRLVNVLDREDGQVAVVSEVAQGNAGARLEAELVDGFLPHIKGNGHAEEHAIGKAVVLDDTAEKTTMSAAKIGQLATEVTAKDDYIPIVVLLVEETCKSASN